MPSARVGPTAGGAAELAGFEVLGRLGRGSQSTVFRVRRAGDGPGGDTDYALKILDQAVADPDAALAAFRREAALVASVDHPALSRVHEVGVVDGRPYLVMDVVTGASLAQFLSTGPPGPDRAMALALDLTDPLAALHHRGLVHRDLKPANIMVQADGRARLIDFGLIARDDGRDDDRAEGRAAVGTLAYCAPEQSGMLKRPVDGRSDLYSLGVILFEAIAGRLPFAAGDVGELLRMHAVTPAPDLAALAPGTPGAVCAMVARLLAKDPDDRYQSARELAAALRAMTGAVADRPDAWAPEPFSGRARERAAIAQRWTAARSGEGGVCVLHGSGGSGRSTLATEAVSQVGAESGAVVLRGRATADDRVPFSPLLAALHDHLDRSGDVTSGWQTAGGDLAEDGAIASGGADSQNRFAAMLTDLLTGLADGSAGLLLVLEDAQWLDTGSRRVLAHLAGELRRHRMLVLATLRDDLPDTAGAEAFLTAVAEAVDLDVSLGPLDESGVAEQISGILPGLAVDDRLVGLLNRRSNGNPFIVQEYLRAAMDAGLLRPDWGRWSLDEAGLDALELPQDAVGLVLARVRGLGVETRDLLVTAAMIGSRFRPEVLAAVAGTHLDLVLPAVTEAARRRLLESREAGDYAFLHDEIREALLADLDEAERAGLHRRIARALDLLPVPTGPRGAEHVYAVAQHYLQWHALRPAEAAGSPDAGPAFAACWAAGLLALNGHAPQEAVVFLTAAAAWGQELPGGFLLAIGTALMRAGHLSEARKRLEQALAAETGELRRAQIFAMLADVHRAGWNTDAAIQVIDQGLAELGAGLPRRRARLVLGTLAVLIGGLIRSWIGAGWGPARGRPHERAAAIWALHEVGAYVGVISMRLDLVTVHSLRLPYWSHRLGPGCRYLHQRCLGFLYGGVGLAGPARRAFDRAQRDGPELVPAETASTINFRGASMYFGGHDTSEQWERDTEHLGRWLDAATFLDATALFNLIAVSDGRTRDAEHWLARGNGRIGERADDVTAFIGSPAVTCALLGRSAEAGAELRRMTELCAGHTALGLTVVRLVCTIKVLVEQGELGAPFEAAVREFEALGLRPSQLLRGHRTIYYEIATGRLAQLRAAGAAEGPQPAGTPDRLAAARASVRRTVKAAGGRSGPLELRMRADLVRADLFVLEGDPRAALRQLDRIGRFQSPDAPTVAFETARISARALSALGGPAAGEALRQSRQAAAVASGEHWPHRVAAVAAEFGLGPSEEVSTSIPGTGGGGHRSVERQRLQAIQQVSAAASRVLEPDELARIALDETIRILTADRAFLFLTDARTGGLVAHLGRDAHGQDVPELTGYSTTLVERVRISGRPLVVTGTEEGAALGAASVVLHGLRSILVAPLRLEGRTLGVVYLDSQVAKGIFTADDAGILTALTNHIATSLETARAAQLEISVHTAKRQRDLAEMLRRTLHSMSDTFDPDEVGRRLMEAARQVIDAENVWIVTRVETEAVTLGLDPVTGATTRSTARPDEALDALIAAADPVAGRPADVPAALRAELAGATSWIGLPLRVHDGRSGALVLATTRPDADLTTGIELAAAMVGQGVTAYDKALLFQRVQQLAVVDELTGIANRRRFFELAERDLAAALRHRRSMSALMIDIDHFKRVNDTYGHATGDEVIREVATRLAGHIRRTDVIGRYGGEEFSLLLNEAGSGDLMPEKLRESVAERPVDTASGPLRVTISVGHARLRPDDDVVALLGRADRQLYRAKELGRNQVCSD